MHGTRRIERSSERDDAKAKQRKRLAEALRANLKRRKAARADGGAGDAAPSPAREPTDKD